MGGNDTYGELATIRSALDHLVEKRLTEGLTDSEHADYEELATRERELLGLGPIAAE